MNKILLIGLILFTGLFSSCKKWLDVQPESEIAEPVLFSTETGFMEAINGIYNKANGEDMYGKELTFGTPEALAQNYSMRDDGQDYRQTSLYNYEQKKFKERKDKIWAGLYSSIVNCNLVLTNVDARKDVFTGINYEIVKGEALGLRAYMHFDLLRLFAPSYLTGATAQGIPYATKYSKDPTPMSTVSGVIDSVIKDLEAAKILLKVDPIRSANYKVGYPTVRDTTKTTEEKSPLLFLQNRRHRMNYFAVCGTLARVYLYKNDKANALLNANEVIASNKFPWTSKADFEAFDESKKDRILYKELVFGWYIPSMAENIKSHWFQPGTNGLYLITDAADYIYEKLTSGAFDARYKYFISRSSTQSSAFYEIVKYRRNAIDEGVDANLHYLMAPAIRLSEMYYIGAEALFPTDPTRAYAYLNQVRSARQIDDKLPLGNEEEFTKELLKEVRKETLAEGQLFYMYKRLNRGIVGQTGAIIPASNKIFVLPLPNDEIVYGGR
ncbi:RagB/SusD family nutrient uptake outer membrane protein [Pedobacter psychroterrae]|uniref:RagB/SusD family nutrient uptake outer membrane protein n=1 Tax=Pedobacter psychroterrae TaxID=2530453 RepID=A0A4R0NUR1_9SPHI|nr:RagB/SusD family nutrient uptake outer membrane protein [Pedobacter psychroterrae]TCD02764.1 RagB/SusD family nutrient uptake outer membrane protein [Pedobacter psychroterrae]